MPGTALGTGHRSGVSTRLLQAPGNLQKPILPSELLNQGEVKGVSDPGGGRSEGTSVGGA